MRCHGYNGQTFITKDQWTAANVRTENMGRKQKIALTIQMAADKFRTEHMGQRKWEDRDAKRAIINAMTIGDKSALDARMKEEFSISGASHILALSGLHLSIIFGLLTMAVGRRLRRNTIVITLVLTLIWAVPICADSDTVTRLHNHVPTLVRGWYRFSRCLLKTMIAATAITDS